MTLYNYTIVAPKPAIFNYLKFSKNLDRTVWTDDKITESIESVESPGDGSVFLQSPKKYYHLLDFNCDYELGYNYTVDDEWYLEESVYTTKEKVLEFLVMLLMGLLPHNQGYLRLSLFDFRIRQIPPTDVVRKFKP